MSGHRHTAHEHEHEFEPQHGLPEPLPAGERLLWQGAPDWRRLARHAFHVRKLACYFAALLVLRFVAFHDAAGGVTGALQTTVQLLPLAAAAIGIALLLAWLTGRTTVYTLTDRRVVMRVGIVLTVTFNLPLRHIESAALHPLEDGTGDIALALDASTQTAYLHLWPHARPWHLVRTQPMLRAVPDAARVAALLHRAWADQRGLPLLGTPPGAEAAVAPVRPQAATPMRPSTVEPVPTRAMTPTAPLVPMSVHLAAVAHGAAGALTLPSFNAPWRAGLDKVRAS